MSPKILITGATGNVGAQIAQGLQTLAIPFRVGTHNTQLTKNSFGSETEIVHFDFTQPETYAATFVEINRMFLVRPPNLANVQRDIAPAIWAAAEAGVKQIIFLSLQGVDQNKVVPHYKIEQAILSTGVVFTFLRAGFFMQNLLTMHQAEIRDHSEINLPVGKAKTSFIDVRDIAAVAVRTLTEEGHGNKKYTLTGSAALDYFQIAQMLSSTLHRTIRYTNPSVIKFIRLQLAQGQKLSYALIVAALYTITRFGNAQTVTQDVEMILGRPPIAFDKFAEDYRSCWLPEEAVTTALK